MATAPLQSETRVRASGNDEIRGSALVAHFEALLDERSSKLEAPAREA